MYYKIIILIISLLIKKNNSLYQFNGSISYSNPKNQIIIYGIDNGETEGTIYNDKLNIEVKFKIKNNNLLRSYPIKVNFKEELIIDNILYYDISSEPEVIYYNYNILSNKLWLYNDSEHILCIYKLNQDAYIPFTIQIITELNQNVLQLIEEEKRKHQKYNLIYIL